MSAPARPLSQPRQHAARASTALIAIAGAGLTLGVGAGAAACSRDARADAPTASPAANTATLVRVQPAAHDTGRVVIRAGGVTEPRATADLAFQIPGRVVRVAVDEGTHVAHGQLLAALDPTDYRLSYEQADLARARQADELARAQQLRASGSIAANEFDKLDNGVRQATVSRALAAKRLADAQLVAPFAGTIARKAVEVGATAATGTTVLTLVDLAEVNVRVGISEADVGQLRVGQPATVEVPALGRSFVGHVAHVGVVAEPASRTYAVQIALPNAAGALRGGMIATVLLPAGRVRDAVVVPAAAVARDPDGATVVFVVAPGAGPGGVRRVRARRIDVGDARGADVEVARGLTAGEPIVVAGQQRLHDGAAVTVATTPATGGR